jgi:hypothetical protein
VKTIGERAFLYTHRMKNVYFKGDAPSAVSAGTDNSSFGPGTVTLYCTTSASGWTDSENYNAVEKKWMGYPLSTWDYVPDDMTFAISGSVVSYNPNNAVTVTLYKGSDVVTVYTIAATDGTGETRGEFVIEDLEKGTYDLVVTKTSHLSYTIKGIKVESASVQIEDDIALIAGDVNGDGCVDLSDVVFLTSSTTYGRDYDEAQNKSADIDGNRCFDLSDLTVITSDSAYNKSEIVVDYE